MSDKRKKRVVKNEEPDSDQIFKQELTEAQAKIIGMELKKTKYKEGDEIKASELKGILKKAKVEADIPDDASVEFGNLMEIVDYYTTPRKGATKKTAKGDDEDEAPEGPKGKTERKGKRKSKKDEMMGKNTDEPPEKDVADYDDNDYMKKFHISPDHLQLLKDAFGQLDPEEKGKISVSDLQDKLSQYPDDKEAVDAVNDYLDNPKLKQLDFYSFVRLMIQDQPVDYYNKSDLEKIYNGFDKDQKGHISAKDLMKVAEELGEDNPEVDYKKMMLVADNDGDKEINFDDFYYIQTVGKDELRKRKKEIGLVEEFDENGEKLDPAKEAEKKEEKKKTVKKGTKKTKKTVTKAKS